MWTTIHWCLIATFVFAWSALGVALVNTAATSFVRVLSAVAVVLPAGAAIELVFFALRSPPQPPSAAPLIAGGVLVYTVGGLAGLWVRRPRVWTSALAVSIAVLPVTLAAHRTAFINEVSGSKILLQTMVPREEACSPDDEAGPWGPPLRLLAEMTQHEPDYLPRFDHPRMQELISASRVAASASCQTRAVGPGISPAIEDPAWKLPLLLARLVVQQAQSGDPAASETWMMLDRLTTPAGDQPALSAIDRLDAWSNLLSSGMTVPETSPDPPLNISQIAARAMLSDLHPHHLYLFPPGITVVDRLSFYVDSPLRVVEELKRVEDDAPIVTLRRWRAGHSFAPLTASLVDGALASIALRRMEPAMRLVSAGRAFDLVSLGSSIPVDPWTNLPMDVDYGSRGAVVFVSGGPDGSVGTSDDLRSPPTTGPRERGQPERAGLPDRR